LLLLLAVDVVRPVGPVKPVKPVDIVRPREPAASAEPAKPAEPAEEGTRQRLDQIATELEAAAEERWRAAKEEEVWV
jgi:hypothetical protein